MKVKVGYITRWRRAIFFTLVACIVVFGLVSTVCAKLIEAALVSNMVSVAALLLCIVVFVLVLSDKWERFEGEGIAAIENGEFTYHDKKRHIEIAMDDIKSVDIKPITLGQTSIRGISPAGAPAQRICGTKPVCKADKSSVQRICGAKPVR